MTDPLLESYEARPYRHGSIPYSHPARMSAIARLLGRPALPVETARVLELGCGEGMNLLPLAERLPRGRFVGIDFSPRQITAGEKARAAAQIENAQLICADLREYEPETGAFDYVIAHGVYSWVPDVVKDRLLAICAKALAREGLAYISYNVHPAWGILGSIRAVLRAHLATAPDSSAELDRLLPALDQAFRSSPGPFAQLAGDAIAELRAKPDELSFHDELGQCNDPVAFLDFVAHAQKHGLGYLAEAHFAEMPWEHLSAGVRQPFDRLRLGPLQQQGLLDLLGYRRFRSSILVSGNTQASQVPEAAAIRECAIGFRMWPADDQIDLAPGAALHLVGSNNFQIGVEKPGQKAFFAALCEAAPERVPFTVAIRRARELLAAAAITEEIDEGLLAKGILKLFTVDQCDLILSNDRDWFSSAERLQPSRLMRYQAGNDLPVVNRWHESVELNDEQRRFLAGDAAIVDEAALRKTGLLF